MASGQLNYDSNEIKLESKNRQIIVSLGYTGWAGTLTNIINETA